MNIFTSIKEQCPKVVPSKTVYICSGHALAQSNAPKNFPLKNQGFARSCPVCSFPIPNYIYFWRHRCALRYSFYFYIFSYFIHFLSYFRIIINLLKKFFKLLVWWKTYRMFILCFWTYICWKQILVFLIVLWKFLLLCL